MFTNLEEIAVPDVADNFLSGPWRSAGLLCHPLDQLPISCLITDLISLQKPSKILAVFLPFWSLGFIQSSSALAPSPALCAALEAEWLQQRHRTPLQRAVLSKTAVAKCISTSYFKKTFNVLTKAGEPFTPQQ